MRIWLADQFLHLGWAFFGQECFCEHNNFNWLARLIGEGQWTDDGDPANWFTKIKFEVGDYLVNVHNYLMKDRI